MGITLAAEPRRSNVVIDALIGYSLNGAPRVRVGQFYSAIGEIGDHVDPPPRPSARRRFLSRDVVALAPA